MAATTPVKARLAVSARHRVRPRGVRAVCLEHRPGFEGLILPGIDRLGRGPVDDDGFAVDGPELSCQRGVVGFGHGASLPDILSRRPSGNVSKNRL